MCVCVCVGLCVCVCVCACVCVCERERECVFDDGGSVGCVLMCVCVCERQTDRQTETESLCAAVTNSCLQLVILEIAVFEIMSVSHFFFLVCYRQR